MRNSPGSPGARRSRSHPDGRTVTASTRAGTVNSTTRPHARAHQDPPRPADRGLPRQTTPQREEQPRSDPQPQTPPRASRLPPPARPQQHPDHHLLDIGAMRGKRGARGSRASRDVRRGRGGADPALKEGSRRGRRNSRRRMNAGLARDRSAWVWVGRLLRLVHRRPEDLIGSTVRSTRRAGGSGGTAGRTKSAIANRRPAWTARSARRCMPGWSAGGPNDGGGREGRTPASTAPGTFSTRLRREGSGHSAGVAVIPRRHHAEAAHSCSPSSTPRRRPAALVPLACLGRRCLGLRSCLTHPHGPLLAAASPHSRARPLRGGRPSSPTGRAVRPCAMSARGRRRGPCAAPWRR